MGQRNPSLAIAFLVLVLIMPQTADSISKLSIKIFFKFLDHKSEIIKGLPDRVERLIKDGYILSNKTSKEERSIGSQSEAGSTEAGSYIVSFNVGTPPQPLSAMLDINSEFMWTQCGRTGTGGGGGSGTVFNPSNSSTMDEELCTSRTCQSFSPQTCSRSRCFFTDNYIDNSTGYLATEKFTFDDNPVKLTFGCSLSSDDDLFGSSSGVIGLGRGPFSLVSQLGNGRFSYYFAPDGDTTTDSFIHFGDAATPTSSRRALSTPLLSSRSDAFSKFYYVGLTGIRVDGKDLPVPSGTFDLHKNGTGGVILTITIPITFLDKRAYEILKNELVNKIGLTTVDGSELGLDLCYKNKSLTAAKIPAMALVFDGDAVMELNTWNYFYADVATGLECLTILESPADASVLGSLIQEGTHMIYDVRGNELQFESLEKTGSPSSQPSKRSSNKGSPPFSPRLPMGLSLVCMLYWVLAAF